jgi:hypothetical protein
MSTARDEIFCKFAIQQGLWSKEEAVLFLNHYRSEGSPGRFGDWASEQGAISADISQKIEAAIDKRVGGPAPQKGVPTHATAKGKPAAGGRGPSGGKSRRRRKRGGGGLGLDFEKNPVQTSIYLACGVLVIVLVVYVIYQFQKADPPPAPPALEESQDEKANSSSANTANQPPPAPVFSEEELRNMDNRINVAVTDARQYLRDGKLYLGINILSKLREDLGGNELPEAQRGRLDQEIAELNEIREGTYSDLMEELREAKSGGNDQDVLDMLDEIEQNCGPDYRARAEKEGA